MSEVTLTNTDLSIIYLPINLHYLHNYMDENSIISYFFSEIFWKISAKCEAKCVIENETVSEFHSKLTGWLNWMRW